MRLVAIDLNHDGKLDLAVAVQHFSNAKNALAVLFGNGDGTFQNAVTSISGSSDDVAAADFNADGNVDLALAGDGKVRIVLGNGDGTFQPVITYSAEGSSDTVAIADLNRDGLLDLLVGGDHTVIFLGNGDGTFDPPVLYAVGDRFARIGYFNRDRDADVVAGAGSPNRSGLWQRRWHSARPAVIRRRRMGIRFGRLRRGWSRRHIIDGVPLSFLRGVGDGRFPRNAGSRTSMPSVWLRLISISTASLIFWFVLFISLAFTHSWVTAMGAFKRLSSLNSPSTKITTMPPISIMMASSRSP